MEHLPLPRHPSKPLERVPLVSEPYDGGDFITYPGRVGWSHALPGEYKYSFAQRERNLPSDDRALEAFLQAWLFFGLLHAIGAKREDFIDGEYVHMKNFVLPQPEPSLMPLLERTEQILALLQITESGVDFRPGFNPWIRRSIVSLYGSLACLAEAHFGYNAKDGMFTTVDRSHMLANGWCPTTVRREANPMTMAPAAYQHYIEHLRLPGSDDHSKCEEMCIHTTTRGGYTYKHICSGSCGGLIGPEDEAVDAILNSGTFPVLRVEYDDAEILSSRQEPPQVLSSDGEAYVAISHIWAQGLGNQDETALPICQLEGLKNDIRSIRGMSIKYGDDYTVETRTLHLWIDSLLCPQHRPTYDLSMSHMRDVYEKAAYVLVLDRALQQSEFDDPIEAMVRLQVSDWMGRLWTLQEGTLPKKILVKFKNKMVDYYELHAAVRRTYQDIIQRPLCDHLTAKSVQLRAYRLTNSNDRSLPLLWAGMSYRNVSYEADQPLCAATLIGLPIEKIAGFQTLPERMVEFWKLLAASSTPVPSVIIFSRVPKLKFPGFRWAPERIMTMNSRRLTFTTIGGELPATLTSSGLRVSLPSWRLILPARPKSIKDSFRKLNSENVNYLHVRSATGKWYFASHKPLDPAPSADERTSAGSAVAEVEEVSVQNEDSGDSSRAADTETPSQTAEAISSQPAASTIGQDHTLPPQEDVTWSLLNRYPDWHVILDEKGSASKTAFRSLLGQISGEQFTPSHDLVLNPYLSAHNIIAEAALSHVEAVLESHSQWMLDWFTWCTGWVSFTRVVAWREFYRNQVAAELQRRITVSQTPAVEEAMLSLAHDGANVNSWFSAHVHHIYGGRYAEITHSWGAEKTWIVD